MKIFFEKDSVMHPNPSIQKSLIDITVNNHDFGCVTRSQTPASSTHGAITNANALTHGEYPLPNCRITGIANTPIKTLQPYAITSG